MSLAELRRLLAEGVPPGRGDEDSVRRQWWAALATLQEDLLPTGADRAGVWLAAPLPALYEPSLLHRLSGWVWTPAEIGSLLQPASPLLPVTPGTGESPPAGRGTATGQRGRKGSAPAGGFLRLVLRGSDGTDPLLVLITPRLQVALALDGLADARRLLVRFEAAVLSEALNLLDRRLQEDDPASAQRLRRSLQELGPLHNDPDLGVRFWPLLAQRLATMAPSVTLQPLAPARDGPEALQEKTVPEAVSKAVGTELALLEALTHEVRTPLATIRTLIRSLLRRTDLPPVVRQRLEQIDGECSEQIDRFGLIFLAAEMQRHPGSARPLAASELARTDLSHLLGELEDLWRRQLERRDLRLRLSIAPELPLVLSDPSRLETMLGGLMDRFSRSLPSGRTVQLSLMPAGARLKLQLRSDDPGGEEPAAPSHSLQGESAAERVGPVLSWNPATGSLQLSRQATRQLFHRLGGRLTERGGTSLTVFFPVAERLP